MRNTIETFEQRFRRWLASPRALTHPARNVRWLAADLRRGITWLNSSDPTTQRRRAEARRLFVLDEARRRDPGAPDDLGIPNEYGNNEICVSCGHVGSLHADKNGTNDGPCTTPSCSCKGFVRKISATVTKFKRLPTPKGSGRRRAAGGPCAECGKQTNERYLVSGDVGVGQWFHARCLERRRARVRSARSRRSR